MTPTVIKDYILAFGAVAGLLSGTYAVIAKPIQDNLKLATLETRMSDLEPEVREQKTNIAVLKSQLASIKEDQTQILNAVLEIKRRL